MDLEPYDFGPIIVDECCDQVYSEIDDSPPLVRSNYVVLAHKNDPICGCIHRKFTINLHMDDSWSFTYTNGEPLTEEEQHLYCREISAAQSMLETRERWRRNGKNIGIWDPDKNFGATGTGSRADDGTVYFPGGRSDGRLDQNCSIII